MIGLHPIIVTVKHFSHSLKGLRVSGDEGEELHEPVRKGGEGRGGEGRGGERVIIQSRVLRGRATRRPVHLPPTSPHHPNATYQSVAWLKSSNLS